MKNPLARIIGIRPSTLAILCIILTIASCSKIEDYIGDGSGGGDGDSGVNTEFTFKASLNVGGEGASEISAYDPKTGKLFVVNVVSNEISVFDISDLDAPMPMPSIPLGSGAPNSVAVHHGKLAVAVEAEVKQQHGSILVFDADTQEQLADYTVGALPDMVTFSPNGQYIVSANEGEPSDDYSVDPPGSVSIIKTANGEVTTLTFEGFNDQEESLEEQGFRVFGPGADLATDVEPEYVAISDNSRTAWVSLQENNGLARIDLNSRTIEAIYPLGFKDHLDPFNTMDVSDEDGQKQLNTWPVRGIYHPDGIAYAKIRGMDLIFSANEGDAREYEGTPGFIEEERIEDIHLDPNVFPNAAMLQDPAMLGRLKITTTLGDIDGDGSFEELYAYGARSFSIWTGYGDLLYDSGDEIGRRTLQLTPERFNDDDGRSDDKGAEPEAVTVLKLKQNTYLLFVGLERNDQIMVYDVSDPQRPEFLYILSHPGDEAPEGLLAIDAKDSPSGKALLVVSNEDSGTVTIYEN